MAHRGPDGAGIWWSQDGKVGLAHRRLAVLDLSQTGSQPMHLKARGLSIVFNGEIYNFSELRDELQSKGHRFKSRCDTEVILAAYAEWGEHCVERLIGMFAFAIYDAPEQKLFLARDRVGEKPLFYHLSEDGRLFFASELKALMANSRLPRRIDPIALDYYLFAGFVPGDLCILAGYHKLPPAHTLAFDLVNGRVRLNRYWELPPFDPSVPVNESTLVDELEWLLQDAVHRQLQADVPVGILLSGGVDSSLVTALAVRGASDIRTYSVGFPGHGRFDETSHARLIAEHFGTRHTELVAEPGWAELVPRLALQFDEPMADPSMIPTFLLCSLVRRECTVAIGGDGGDELFGGYVHYNQLLEMAVRAGFIPLGARRVIAKTAASVLPVGFRGRGYLASIGTDFALGLPKPDFLFDAPFRRRLLAGQGNWQAGADSLYQQLVPSNKDLVQRATRMDYSNYLPEDILVKVDRASMLASLEVRAPLLDHRVVEFAYRQVPSVLKATRKHRKILPKMLTRRLLPPSFDRERKQGFNVPLANWLVSGKFRNLFWDTLDSNDNPFDRAALQRVLRCQDLGMNNSIRLFALVHFELWRKAYKVSL